MDAPRPENEATRLHVLRECDVLDGALRPSLDGAARLAASLCDAPIALVSLVDTERQVFAGRVGLGAAEGPRPLSFCAWTILGRDAFCVPDARADARFADNALVTGPPGIRFYAGFPLRTPDGYVLGALCVIDTRPRALTDVQAKQMGLLAEQVATQLDQRRWRKRFEEARRSAEQRAAAQAAAQRELRFQHEALDRHAAVVVTDARGVITDVNHLFCAVSGWRREDLVGRTHRALRSGHHGRSRIREMLAVLSKGGVWQGEVCHRARSGRPFWLETSVVPFREGLGKTARYVAVGTDITGRKVADRLLREAEERSRLIVDNAMDAVITIDDAGAVSGWNAQAVEVFGYRSDEAVGRQLDELIIPEPAPAPQRAAPARAAAHGMSCAPGRRMKTRALHKDGREFPVELSIIPVHANGRTHFIAFVRDITERRRADDELRRAKDAAESAARAKAEFLANMSHEIRTPLTALLGFTELLVSDTDFAGSTECRDEAVRTIRRNAEHLLTVINDILDLSAIESGRLSVERTPMSPARVVDEVCELLHMRAFEKGLSLEVERDPCGAPLVLCDPIRFRQIVANLVSNAIKFTDRGGVRVRVAAHPAPDGRIEVVVRVEDTGVGIAPEQMARLFDSFWQGDASLTRRVGGTGLGLTISRALARLLDGEISVESVPGRGSVFSVRFVAAPAGADAPRSASAARDAGVGELAGVRVLLAEDGADNQRLITHYLRRAGATVRVVANGRLAVDEVLGAGGTPVEAPAPFDLVIMDMQMPEMDGYAAVRALRERGQVVPVLALTAHAMESDRARCLAAGCDDYASKPIDRAMLVRACARLAVRRAAAGMANAA